MDGWLLDALMPATETLTISMDGASAPAFDAIRRRADFDKVVAVGVRRMVDASAVPVSPRIYSWDPRTEAWTVWGEVRGTVDLPVPAAASAPIP